MRNSGGWHAGANGISFAGVAQSLDAPARRYGWLFGVLAAHIRDRLVHRALASCLRLEPRPSHFRADHRWLDRCGDGGAGRPAGRPNRPSDRRAIRDCRHDRGIRAAGHGDRDHGQLDHAVVGAGDCQSGPSGHGLDQGGRQPVRTFPRPRFRQHTVWRAGYRHCPARHRGLADHEL